jgi:hypothetical protein
VQRVGRWIDRGQRRSCGSSQMWKLGRAIGGNSRRKIWQIIFFSNRAEAIAVQGVEGSLPLPNIHTKFYVSMHQTQP